MKKNMFYQKRFIWGAVIFAIFVLAFLLINKNIFYSLIPCKKLDQSYIISNSYTALPRIYKITMPFSGTLQEIKLTPGTTVSKGYLLASIDSDKILMELQIAKGNIEKHKYQIEICHYSSFANTMLSAACKWIELFEEILSIYKIRVKECEELYDYSKVHYASFKESAEALSMLDRDKAETDFVVKKAELQESQVACNAMQVFVELWKLVPDYIKGLMELEKLEGKALQGDLLAAQAKFKNLNRLYEKSKLISKVNGTVLKVYVTNERYLPIGSEIMDVGIMDHLEVISELPTTQVINIKVGAPVDIYCDSLLKTTPFHGKVKSIEPQSFIDKLPNREKIRKVKVKIFVQPEIWKQLSKNNKSFGVGYDVYVKIYL